MFDKVLCMELLTTTEPVAELTAEAPLDELCDALISAAATISAAEARFAQVLAVFRSRDGHAIGSGFPTFAQWATVDLGLSRHQTAVLVDAGDDAARCPELRAAWEAGELATTKATAAIGVWWRDRDDGLAELTAILHVVYWENGGPTDLANLVVLCNRHHHDLHNGEFAIEADGHGGFTFFDRWRRTMGPPRVRAEQPCPPSAGTTRARSGGDPRLGVNDAVTAIACCAPDAA
ncbi:MAG: HNH endonuclease [Actinobacteria bacterium]|nr:HNH endonuclease [Actinomycetota bacterium]